MKRRRLHWVLGLMVAACLAGCGKQIPEDIIQPEQMEQLLYDYHLSLSMGNRLSYGENYQKEAYKNYVFQKHGITEAEFDSSMVWYTRHTEELAALYQKVGERFRSDKRHMQHLMMLRENKPLMTAVGDTVDIWHDRRLYRMTDAPLAHRITFEIPADSNFHLRDRFVWTARFHFLAEGERQATMGFNVLFDNDSVMGKVVHVSRSGMQQLELQSDSAYTVRKVSGFISYHSTPSVGCAGSCLHGDSLAVTSNMRDSMAVTSAALGPGLILHDLSLVRYHEPVADSTAVDASLAADSVGTLRPKPTSGKVQLQRADRPQVSTDRIRR